MKFVVLLVIFNILIFLPKFNFTDVEDGKNATEIVEILTEKDVFVTNDTAEFSDYSSAIQKQWMPNAMMSKKRQGYARYAVGERLKCDKIIALGGQGHDYEDPSDFQFNFEYPAGDAEGMYILTYVDIIIETSSGTGRAYVTDGGIGTTYIKFGIQGSSQTQRVEYKFVIFGCKPEDINAIDDTVDTKEDDKSGSSGTTVAPNADSLDDNSDKSSSSGTTVAPNHYPHHYPHHFPYPYPYPYGYPYQPYPPNNDATQAPYYYPPNYYNPPPHYNYRACGKNGAEITVNSNNKNSNIHNMHTSHGSYYSNPMF